MQHLIQILVYIFNFGVLFDLDMHTYKFARADILVHLDVCDTRLLQCNSFRFRRCFKFCQLNSYVWA
jgi:hypothetical protein